MNINFLYKLIRRYSIFVIFYGKNWWIICSFFISLYAVSVLLLFSDIEFTGGELLSFLFHNKFPIEDYSEFSVPYIWFFFLVFSLLAIFFSIVELLEKQNLFLLIRSSSRLLVSAASILTILGVSFVYTLLFIIELSIILWQPILFSTTIFKYSLLLFSSVSLLNYFSYLIYLITSNSIFSLVFSMFALIISSMVNIKNFPFKSSLILNGDISRYTRTDSFVVNFGMNVVLIIFLSIIISILIKRKNF
ncbi:hypothetical protein J2Z51_000825 [Enterococcus alcedinis]|nr:hypothetical protein [Enterococcus alcedinis]